MRLPAIAATLGLLSLTACATTPPAQPAASPAPTGGAALAGAEWAVFEIAGQPVVANSKPSIQFAEGRVSGAGSCNRFMGGYTVGADGLSLEMGQMASTMMACPDPLMDQERRFLDVLGAVKGYEMQGDVLVLKTADGKTVKARR